jgi:hypothetical protein
VEVVKELLTHETILVMNSQDRVREHASEISFLFLTGSLVRGKQEYRNTISLE